MPSGSREGRVRAETPGAQALLSATYCCHLVMRPTVQFSQDNPCNNLSVSSPGVQRLTTNSEVLGLFFFFFFSSSSFLTQRKPKEACPETVQHHQLAFSASGSDVVDSLRPRGLWPARLLCPWDSPGKNTGVSCHSLLQGVFPTQGSDPGLLSCRQTLYRLSYKDLFSAREMVTFGDRKPQLQVKNLCV